MRNLILAAATGAALLAGAAISNRAEALPFGASSIGAAGADLAVIDQVHCVPGFFHHRFRPNDGCFVSRPILVPRIYRPYRVYRPYRRFRH
jgi:hypothetical protein